MSVVQFSTRVHEKQVAEDAKLLHELSSPLAFKAYERPLWYEGRHGDKFDNTGHKALVRMVHDAPVCLNVVRNTYKVVQNEELFNLIHSELTSAVTPSELASCQINDKISYNGAKCFREYIFPDIAVVSPEKDKIAFRIVIENGFGTGAIKLHAGAIDFFCTNGIILGEYTSAYAKHTSGLTLDRFHRAVKDAIRMFWTESERWQNLKNLKLKDDDTIKLWLKDEFGERLASKLFHQFEIERRARGGSHMWALFSVFTQWSSHEHIQPMRNTANDHAASTMMQRETRVRRLFSNEETIRKLAA